MGRNYEGVPIVDCPISRLVGRFGNNRRLSAEDRPRNECGQLPAMAWPSDNLGAQCVYGQ